MSGLRCPGRHRLHSRADELMAMVAILRQRLWNVIDASEGCRNHENPVVVRPVLWKRQDGMRDRSPKHHGMTGCRTMAKDQCKLIWLTPHDCFQKRTV